MAAAAAFPACFTALPARLPRDPPPLVKPCSASEASAAVAATATSSATNGLCSSWIKASPILASDREPPPPLEDATRATDVPVFLFLLLSAFAPLFGVAFLAIVIAPGLSLLDA